MNSDQPDFLAPGNHVFDCFRNRPHSHDDPVCIGCTIIDKGMVFTTGHFRDFLHIGIHKVRNAGIE